MKSQPLRFNYYLVLAATFLFLGFTSCKNQDQTKRTDENTGHQTEGKDSLFFDISLAQWSLHKPIYDGKLDPMDFAQKASELGFNGIEYVSGFYAERIKNAQDPQSEMQRVLDSLKAKNEEFGVENLLIMIDGEGDLAVTDSVARDQAVENHKKWIDAAAYLGCHSIRVNLFGSENPEEWKKASIDALSQLANYGAQKNVHVLVENHGLLSSNADLLVEVMKEVNSEYCGTLPDFGNFCLKREGGERWEAECVEEYPRYEGVRKMMPFAVAVSAKSYSFNAEGDEELIDYKKMLHIIKEAGYTGFIGVEFEGEDIPAQEGILATKELLIKAAKQL